MNLMARGGGVRAVRLDGVGTFLSFALLVSISIPTLAETPRDRRGNVTPARTSRGSSTLDRNIRRAATNGEEAAGTADTAKPAPDSQVKYNGTPTVGSRITIGLDGPQDPQAVYRWVQVEGPPVVISDPSKPVIELTIPAGAERLGFEVTKEGPDGVKAGRLIIPVGTPRATSPKAAVMPKADAGDDQVGLVGRKITLNGASPTQGDRIGFRWFQLAGPKVEQANQDRTYYSFTPATSGIYTFGLVVAASGSDSTPLISEPDSVTVTVGELPAPAPVSSMASPLNGFDQAIRYAQGVANKDLLEKVASVFETVSERSSLYSSFGALSSEMIRRFDAVIPPDANSRYLWSQGVFAPLTQHVAAEMRTVGLELGYPQSLHQELSVVQKEKLRALFSLYSREFRSRSTSR